MLRTMIGLRPRYQPLQIKISELEADALRGPRRAVKQQHRADAAEDGEGRDARIGLPERSRAHAFLDERGVENVSALAPILDQAITRVGEARFFGGDQTQQVAAFIIKLDGDLDSAAQARADVLARIVGR